MNTKLLKQKILDLAIRGKLVPQDPNDEPASELLKRIRAEKEKLIAEGKIKRSKKTGDKPHYENIRANRMQNQTCLSSAEVQPNEGVANAPFEIPESWIWVRLSDVCQIVGRIGFRGYTKSDLVESNGAITLSPSNIVEGKMDYSKCTYISWKKYEESPEIQIQNGDILLVKTGSSYGKCALVENLPQKATINPQFVTLKYIAIQATILTYILQSDYARTNYDNFVLGTAIPTFTQVALGDMLIPLVPQNEQTRILQEIARLFALIDEIDANKQNLQEYIKQAKSKVLSLAVHGKLVPQDPNDEPAVELLKRINPNAAICDTSHYGNLPFEIPKSWTWVKIKDIAVSELGKTLDRGKNKGKPYDYLCALNVKWRAFDLTTLKQILLEDDEKDRYLVRKGDLLICEGGDVGRAAIWESDREIYYQNALHRVRFKGNINQYFYLYILQYYKWLGLIDDVSGGVTIKHFTQNSMQKLLFPLPPIDEQNRIVQRLGEIFSTLDNITSEL